MSAKTLAMILAGGEGRRLAPLTHERAKPAVPFGGRYRIIDFVLSNFANSGVLRMKVLTQYKSDSLNTHISRGWRLSSMLGQFVEAVPAQQRTGPEWYRGSADAIYQNLNLVTDEEPDYVFVFGADHIYRMDVRQMLDFHVRQKADCTVAAIPVPIEEASSFGVITADDTGRMVDFQEKPKSPKPMLGAPAKVVFANVAEKRVGTATDSVISEGCIISGGRVNRTVLSPRVRINSFADVDESILFEGVNVGRHAQIRRAIIDKNVDIPQGLRIGYDPEEDRKQLFVSPQGIVVVPKGMRPSD